MNTCVSSNNSTAERGVRFPGIDSIRVIAAISIVFIHIPHVNQFALAADEFARWAVPFFFAASGFLAAGTYRSVGSETRRLFVRLGIPYAFWVACYCAALMKPSQVITVKDISRIILFGGPAIHLWFIPALIMSLIIYRTIQEWKLLWMLLLAITIYSIGLCISAYPIQNMHLPFNPRNGPFLSVPMVIAGVVYRRYMALNYKYAILLIIASFILYALEVYYLKPRQIDQTIMTLMIGVSPLILAVNLRGRIYSLIGGIGKYSFGVYLIHVGVITILQIFYFPTDMINTLIFVGTVSIISFAMSYVLSNIPYVRAVVQ